MWASAPLQRVSHNFWRTGSEVCSQIPKLATNLAIWSRSCQSCYELRHEVGNYVANFATISRTSWSKVMADLGNWMSLFRDKLDQKTYDFISQTLVTNQFTSRLQLKFLTSEQLDYMFTKDLALGAESSSRISCRFTEGWITFTYENQRTKEGRKELHGNETSTATESRRVSLTCSTKFARGHRCSVGIFNRSAPLSIFI